MASADLQHRVERRLAAREYPATDRERALAIVASVSQGLRLRDLIADNGLTGIPPFGGLIMQGDVAHWQNEPRITIVGPSRRGVDSPRRY